MTGANLADDHARCFTRYGLAPWPCLLPIRWPGKQDLGNAMHWKRRKLRCLSKTNSLCITVTLLESWWREGKFQISFSHPVPWNKTLRPYYRKGIQKSISFLANAVFYYPKLSVFSFWLDTPAAPILFAFISEPLSGSPAAAPAPPCLHFQGLQRKPLP